MSQPLHLAFVWHMHQPYYRDLATKSCAMPWVRLHAAKDYVDMVKRLEPFPSIHQTFNLVPSLLDQIEEYLPPQHGTDEFLELSRKPAAQLSAQERRFIIQWFFLANVERMIRPYPSYHDLLAKRGPAPGEEEWPHILARFTTQDLLDLQVWFNLAWIDPWLREQNPRLAALERRGSQFTEQDKAVVLQAHLDYLAQVLPVYRDAAARGQVELTSSPYYHPIMPLLCDVRSALHALPHLPLPQRSFHHPEDARWQLQEGITRHTAAFGQPPAGLWPPEGSVSEDLVRLVLEAGIRWIATDEEILWRSLQTGRSAATLYRPHLLQRNEGQAAIIFRDRELSDLIGFVYSQWDAQLAVADFMERLGAIHQQFQSAAHPPLVSIILDGENAWEFYQHDGHPFLTELYRALAADARFRCVTVSEFLAQHPPDRTASIPHLAAGSWIDGNFATWVGHPEKNAAWEQLIDARAALEGAPEQPAPSEARRSLGIAEGSDWMWWFGDTHFSLQADEFDRLFRMHLANSYRFAGLDVPHALQQPIRRRIIAPLYAPTGLLHPVIDGRESSYYEWLYAGSFDLTKQHSAMHRARQHLRRLFYGFDAATQYLRLDMDPHLRQMPSWTLELVIARAAHITLIHEAGKPLSAVVATVGGQGTQGTRIPCAYDQIIELAIPNSLLGVTPGKRLKLTMILSQDGDVLEQCPSQGACELLASPDDLASSHWPV